ncbi:MAG: transcription termination factor Rho [Nitriliruptorales bacterium]|nr:transcription termination factor Rho [Nitriliruptorales bacterium]
MDRSVLARKQLTELKGIASHLQMRGYQRLKKAELIEAIVRAAERSGDGRPAGPDGSPSIPSTADAPSNGRTAVAVAERPDARAEGEDSGRSQSQLPLDQQGDDRRPSPTPAPDASEEATRTRVRTRSRERTQSPDEPQRNGGPGTSIEDRQSARTERPEAAQDPVRQDRAQREQPTEDGQRGEGQQIHESPSGEAGGSRTQRQQRDSRDNEEGGNRRRRSRRERRRNKQQSQQGRQYREDDQAAEPGEVRSGVLDILPEGYGFLRTSGYLPGERDVYISQSQVRKHGLRRGDVVEGPIRVQKSNEKVPALHHVQMVNGQKPDEQGNLPHRPDFKDMTPLFPDERLRLETPEGPISMRIIDLMSPIGKGQRGLIVSPPKAGKTTILKELGQAIAYNNPECHLMVVLVDERPEEVTDMQRSVPGEIVASTFDRPADDHTQIAELAMERAKRLVEAGRDVVVLLDSITRLARAYNLAAPASGRIMSGGVDSTALYPPKRFFGAARNIEGGGSLTIIASALIETGSKMDEVIFEEFKGTGNAELRLDRKLEQKRVFPAIDIEASGTRKEELLLDREELTIIWKLRRVLHALEGPAAVELLIDKMKQTRSNNQFLVQIQKSNLQT